MDANHDDFPLPEPSGCMSQLQRALDRTRTNEHLRCWLALFSLSPVLSKIIYWWIIVLDLLQVGRLRVHPGIALAAAVGGELLELAEPLYPVDTGLCTLSPCLRPSLPGPPWPGCTARTHLAFLCRSSVVLKGSNNKRVRYS